MPITINGSGTIGGLSVNGLPAGTVDTATIATSAITQTKIASGVGVTGPAFSVYPSANVTLTTGYSHYLVTNNTESFDVGSCFNNTSGTVTLNGLSVPAYSFCPNIAGYYQVNHGVVLTNASSNILTILYKNGSAVAYGTIGVVPNGQAYNSAAVGSFMVYLNGTGDYITHYVQANASAMTMAGNNPSQTFFQGFLVRAA